MTITIFVQNYIPSCSLCTPYMKFILCAGTLKSTWTSNYRQIIIIRVTLFLRDQQTAYISKDLSYLVLFNPFIVPRFRESVGTLNLIRPSVPLSVRPSVCPSVTKTLTLAITFALLQIELWYLACLFLVTRPFQRYHVVTLTVTFDLLQGQICCQAGDRNSSEFACFTNYWRVLYFRVSMLSQNYGNINLKVLTNKNCFTESLRRMKSQNWPGPHKCLHHLCLKY